MLSRTCGHQHIWFLGHEPHSKLQAGGFVLNAEVQRGVGLAAWCPRERVNTRGCLLLFRGLMLGKGQWKSEVSAESKEMLSWQGRSAL